MTSIQSLTAGHIRAAIRLPAGLDTQPARAAGRMLPGGWHLDPPGPGTSPAAI